MRRGGPSGRAARFPRRTAALFRVPENPIVDERVAQHEVGCAQTGNRFRVKSDGSPG
jgi:hypothetical protein